MHQMRWLELIKNYDWEILYHSGKANVVADALSKKERLKIIMSLGEFIRDFEKMEIEVKGIQEERLKDNLRGFTRKKVIFKILKNRNMDKGNMTKGQRGGRHFKGELDTRCMDSVWLAIKTSWKMNDYSRIKLSKIEAAEKGVVKLWWYSEWKHIRDTKVDVVIKRLERNWNDHITRIEFSHDNRSYVAQDARTRSSPKDQGYNRSNQRTTGSSQEGHKKYVDLTRKDKE
ncbi:hypothetical protein AgCh_025686 [Apium graveolens]